MSSLDGNFSKFLPSFVCRLSLLVIAVLVRWVERVSRLVIIWHPGYGIATAAEKGLRTAAVVMEGAERLSFESPPRDGFVGGIFALGGIGLGLFIVGPGEPGRTSHSHRTRLPQPSGSQTSQAT